MGGGTIQEITDMLDVHYNGKINISDYWAVGDSRSVELNSMGKNTILSEQPAQTTNLVIIGFNHDDLTTSVNGITKAAITVQTKDCLESDGGFHRYNKYNSSVAWSSSDARDWCGDFFRMMLPSDLKSLVKSVTKQSNKYACSDYSAYYRSQESTDDSVFFVSMFEVFGEMTLDENRWGPLGTLNPDGSQYDYMKTQSNRIKEGPIHSGNTWMTRTIALPSSTYVVVEVGPDGTGSYSNVSSTTNGIAPAFCL